MLVIDAANVIGSRPDGWWRDRAGAAARLVDQIRAACRGGSLTGPALVVLEGQARAGVAEGTAGDVEVVHAPGEGDDEIVIRAARVGGEVMVVTADRGLRDRVRAVGASVVGPRWLLERLAPQ